jgi:predicted glycoside hydrolase/deacetylase ChbG (UPF0249 family)
MGLLIVNADDYGLTEGVCRAILRANREGIVTSTSVLALASAFRRGAPWLAEQPDLGIGVHLALVGEDPPLLTASEIPSLLDRRGRLAPSWPSFLGRAVRGRIDRDEMVAEMSAQVEAVASVVGAERLTHLDTHQHLHLWPGVGRVVVSLACRFGIPAVRTGRSTARSPRAWGVNHLAVRFGRNADAHGLRSTEAFAGIDEAGSMTDARLLVTLERLSAIGPASAEIGVHPGEPDDQELSRYRWGYRWGEELEALISPGVRQAVERSGFVLGSFASLATSP